MDYDDITAPLLAGDGFAVAAQPSAQPSAPPPKQQGEAAAPKPAPEEQRRPPWEAVPDPAPLAAEAAAAWAAAQADSPSAGDVDSNSGNQGTVYIASSTRDKKSKAKWVYHTSPKCRYIKAAREVEPVPAAGGRPLEPANWHLCKVCAKKARS